MNKLEIKGNVNYTGTFVILDKFVDIPNADFIKAAIIFGNSVIVSKDTQVGEKGIYFPTETKLDHRFLAENNLYREASMGNVDPLKKGFFENNGRIKAMRFRGSKSEGFWIPFSSLSYLEVSEKIFKEGVSFDTIDGKIICQKYVVKTSSYTQTAKGKVAKLKDSIVENQFRFHFDTEQLVKNLHKITSDSYVSISSKWHGTSAVIAKPLVIRNLSWIEKILSKIGVNINDKTYGLVYSSRRVIKAVNNINKSNNIHFYDSDIWGEVANNIESQIPNGISLYGEIVGYTPDGKMIQKGYHYGSDINEHKFVIYRVTITNSEGKVYEFSWPMMKEFCEKYGLIMVPELYYGPVLNIIHFDSGKTILSILNERGKWEERDFQEVFIETLRDNWVHDQNCEYNNFEVPAEGIVIRKDFLNEALNFKFKNFAFLERESKLLDNGEEDMESSEFIEISE